MLSQLIEFAKQLANSRKGGSQAKITVYDAAYVVWRIREQNRADREYRFRQQRGFLKVAVSLPFEVTLRPEKAGAAYQQGETIAVRHPG